MACGENIDQNWIINNVLDEIRPLLGSGGSTPAHVLEVALSGTTYSTISSALTAAGSGDLIIVYPGSYNEQVILKDGVNFYLTDGAAVVYTAADGTPALTDNNVAVSCKIAGQGSIQRSGGNSTSKAVYIQNASSSVDIEARLVSNVATNAPAINITRATANLFIEEIQASGRGLDIGDYSDSAVVRWKGKQITGIRDYGILVQGGTFYGEGKSYSQMNSALHCAGDSNTYAEFTGELLSEQLYGFENSGGSAKLYDCVIQSLCLVNTDPSYGAAAIGKYSGDLLTLDNVALLAESGFYSMQNQGTGSPYHGEIRILTSSYANQGLDTNAGGMNITYGRQNLLIDGVYTAHAPLDTTYRVPAAMLGSGTTDGTKFLSDARAWVNINTDNVTELSGATNQWFSSARAVAAITGGASSIATSNLTINRALISDSSGKVAVSTVTSTELGYLSGATGNIQTQINAKPSGSGTANKLAYWTGTTALGDSGLYVDAANGRLGVGAAPSNFVDIVNPTSTIWGLKIKAPYNTTGVSFQGGQVLIQSTTSGNSSKTAIAFQDSAGTEYGGIGKSSGDNNYLWITSNNQLVLYANNNPILISDNTVASAFAGAGRLHIPIAPTATANNGLVNLGTGAWDGATAGFYSGSSSGTHFAINAASGYAGSHLDIQTAGVRTFNVRSGVAYVNASPLTSPSVWNSGLVVGRETVNGTPTASVKLIDLTQNSNANNIQFINAINNTGRYMVNIKGGGGRDNNMGTSTGWILDYALEYTSSSFSTLTAPSSFKGWAWLVYNGSTTYNPRMVLSPSGQFALGYASLGADPFGSLGTLYGTFSIVNAPTASATTGLVNWGDGYFDGVTSGKFSGSSSGTVHAINITGSADFANWQASGVSKVKITSDGIPTFTATGNADMVLTLDQSNATATSGYSQVLWKTNKGSTSLSIGVSAPGSTGEAYIQVTDYALSSGGSRNLTISGGNGSVSTGAVTFKFTDFIIGGTTGPAITIKSTSSSVSTATMTTNYVDGGSKIRAMVGKATGSNWDFFFVPGDGSSNGANYANIRFYMVGDKCVIMSSASSTSLLGYGRLLIPDAPTASANYGLLNLGNSPFDGSTSGFYAGNSSGTYLAMNAASGYAGALADFQIAGVSKFMVRPLNGSNDTTILRLGPEGSGKPNGYIYTAYTDFSSPTIALSSNNYWNGASYTTLDGNFSKGFLEVQAGNLFFMTGKGADAAFNNYSLAIVHSKGASTGTNNGMSNFGVGDITTKMSKFNVKNYADFTATGTSTVNGSTTVTGSNTLFLSEVGIGDRIAVSSAPTTYATVTAIASDTSLTVSAALGNGTTQTITVKKAYERFMDSSSNVKRFMNDLGYIGIYGGNSFFQPTALVHLGAGTATAGTAPLKFSAGTLLAALELGALELTDDGTTGHLFITLNQGGVLTRVQIV